MYTEICCADSAASDMSAAMYTSRLLHVRAKKLSMQSSEAFCNFSVKCFLQHCNHTSRSASVLYKNRVFTSYKYVRALIYIYIYIYLFSFAS